LASIFTLSLLSISVHFPSKLRRLFLAHIPPAIHNLSLWSKPVFGDGLTQEQLTASLGNRKADLLIKMIPPVVTTETLQNGQKPVLEYLVLDRHSSMLLINQEQLATFVGFTHSCWEK
jgi:hypothetical protein